MIEILICIVRGRKLSIKRDKKELNNIKREKKKIRVIWEGK